MKCRKKAESENLKFGEFEELPRGTASDIVLRDKSFNIPKYPKCDEYKRGPASMVYKFFDKKSSGGAIKIKIISNQQLHKNYTKQLLENVNNEKYIHLLKSIFGC